MDSLIVGIVEGDKVEIVSGDKWLVMSPREAETLAYDLLDAAEIANRGGEPTTAQLEALNNPDSGPYRTSDTPTYRETLRDAGRG